MEAQPPASLRERWTKVAREAYDLGLVAREVQREGLGPQPIWPCLAELTSRVNVNLRDLLVPFGLDHQPTVTRESATAITRLLRRLGSTLDQVAVAIRCTLASEQGFGHAFEAARTDRARSPEEIRRQFLKEVEPMYPDGLRRELYDIQNAVTEAYGEEV